MRQPVEPAKHSDALLTESAKSKGESTRVTVKFENTHPKAKTCTNHAPLNSLMSFGNHREFRVLYPNGLIGRA